MYDMIVVGGGPAGLTAAIYALRAGKTVLVIEKNGFGGQIAFSPKVENIPGTKVISGAQFAEDLTEQTMALGADVELEKVVKVEKTDGIFTVTTEEAGAYQGKAVILAVGVKHRTLGLPGEEELIGNGISFCAVCDGAFYAGQEVAMIGGGNSALQEALLLAEVCKKVTVVQNLADFTGEKKLADALLDMNRTEQLGPKERISVFRVSANGYMTTFLKPEARTVPLRDQFAGRLNAQGYEVVTVSELLGGTWTRTLCCPACPSSAPLGRAAEALRQGGVG